MLSLYDFLILILFSLGVFYCYKTVALFKEIDSRVSEIEASLKISDDYHNPNHRKMGLIQ